MDDLLKEWMPKLKGRVGVIKIDIEGFEPYVRGKESCLLLYNMRWDPRLSKACISCRCVYPWCRPLMELWSFCASSSPPP